MKAVIGLGNPGEKYQNTRHNVGFMVLDSLLKDLEPVEKTVWSEDKKGKLLTCNVTYCGQSLTLAKPETFMNSSGFAVAHFLRYNNISPEDMMVVYDDLDLPMGKIRVRFGGAAGGHRGVESIIREVGTDRFLRLRLGIGHPQRHDGGVKEGKSHIAVEDYVLQSFAPNEKSHIRHMIKEANRTICLIQEHGMDLYMSKYNGEEKKEEEK